VAGVQVAQPEAVAQTHGPVFHPVRQDVFDLDLGGDIGGASVPFGVPGVAQALEKTAGGIVTSPKPLDPVRYFHEGVSAQGARPLSLLDLDQVQAFIDLSHPVTVVERTEGHGRIGFARVEEDLLQGKAVMTAIPVVHIQDRTGSEMGFVQVQRFLGRTFVEQEIPGAGPFLIITGLGSRAQVAVKIGNRSQIN